MKKNSLMLTLGCALIIGAVFYSCIKCANMQKQEGNPVAAHINDDLWAYFPIRGGSLADSSGHGHRMDLYGASLSSDSWGNSNGALDFNPSGDTAYALIPDGATFAPASFTISAYIMPRAGSGIFFTKMNHNDGSGPSMVLGVDPRHNNGAMIYSSVTYPEGTMDACSSTGNGGVLCIGQPWQLNTWYHFAATFDAGVQKLYINGNLVDSVQSNMPQQLFCSTAPFELGNWWPGDLVPYYNGKINMIRIYTRAISAQEVSYLYSQYTN